MNVVVLMGRLTRDPETRYSQDGKAVTRFTIAVDRRTKEKEADFISCVAFGHTAEFIDKYFKQGKRIAVDGRIQTGSYTNKEGKKVYTTDVVVNNAEFAESKGNDYQQGFAPAERKPEKEDDFVTVPEGIEEELPFM